uniref:Uncharacterized protein n=1 Tax=Romanomermis culicivorax TaxID=13658 RepID=A0A915ITJ8_ROMCU
MDGKKNKELPLHCIATQIDLKTFSDWDCGGHNLGEETVGPTSWEQAFFARKCLVPVILTFLYIFQALHKYFVLNVLVPKTLSTQLGIAA